MEKKKGEAFHAPHAGNGSKDFRYWIFVKRLSALIDIIKCFFFFRLFLWCVMLSDFF
jgi:hypothetical protein